MKDQLDALYRYQCGRLESELGLHWQRIQITSVALFGLFTACGYLFLESKGSVLLWQGISKSSVDEKGVLLAIALLATFFVGWYLTVLTVSGSYWIRVSEQKLSAIEEVFLGARVYSEFLESSRRASSLTACTRRVYTAASGFALVSFVAQLLGLIESSTMRSSVQECSGMLLLYNFLMGVLVLVVWLCSSVIWQKQKVFGTKQDGDYPSLVDQVALRKKLTEIFNAVEVSDGTLRQ